MWNLLIIYFREVPHCILHLWTQITWHAINFYLYADDIPVLSAVLVQKDPDLSLSFLLFSCIWMTTVSANKPLVHVVRRREFMQLWLSPFWWQVLCSLKCQIQGAVLAESKEIQPCFLNASDKPVSQQCFIQQPPTASSSSLSLSYISVIFCSSSLTFSPFLFYCFSPPFLFLLSPLFFLSSSFWFLHAVLFQFLSYFSPFRLFLLLQRKRHFAVDLKAALDLLASVPVAGRNQRRKCLHL